MRKLLMDAVQAGGEDARLELQRHDSIRKTEIEAPTIQDTAPDPAYLTQFKTWC